MSEEGFAILDDDMCNHMKGRDYFVQGLFSGAEPANRLNARMVTELAWRGLFICHMLRLPNADELVDFIADWTAINCPSFKANPEWHNYRLETIISMNFEQKIILIGSTEYAGENKKCIFFVLNFLMLQATQLIQLYSLASPVLAKPHCLLVQVVF